MTRVRRWWVACGAAAVLAGCTAQPSSGPDTTTEPPPAAAQSPATAPTASATVRGRYVIVRGDVSPRRLRTIADDADKAARWVSHTWGDAWTRRGRVTIRVPRDESGFRALGGAGRRVAATTTSHGVVVINPEARSEVTEEGMVVVLAHELTHVALRQYAASRAPRWVIEGSAEFTAYRRTSLSLPAAAPQVATMVRAGRPPAGPPADDRFAVDAPHLQRAYQEAHTWCVFLVDRYGLTRFTRFVQRADRKGAAAFRAAFHTTPAELRPDYRRWLRERMRPTGTATDSAGGSTAPADK